VEQHTRPSQEEIGR
jgi:transposase